MDSSFVVRALWRPARSLCVAVTMAIALAMAATPRSASATRVMPLQIEALMRQTVAIFIGTVSASDPTCPGDKKPCTKVTFSDIEMVAGRALSDRQAALVLPEGLLDDGTTLKIVGAPRYLIGQRYLIFMRADRWFLTPATNWFHSVFRELRVGPEGRTSIFVNYNGLAVENVSEQGFKLGEQLAPPDALLQPTPTPDRNRARSGTSSSNPPRISETVRSAFAQPDFDWSKLALPKDELVRQLRGLADKLGLAADRQLYLTPGKPGTDSDQAAAQPGGPGVDPAVPDGGGRRPPQPEPPPAGGGTRPPGEPPVERPSSPGRSRSD